MFRQSPEVTEILTTIDEAHRLNQQKVISVAQRQFDVLQKALLPNHREGNEKVIHCHDYIIAPFVRGGGEGGRGKKA